MKKADRVCYIAPLRSAIEVREVRFSSNLKFDKDGELYRTVDPEEPPYVGPPSDEIDHAWEEITQRARIYILIQGFV